MRNTTFTARSAVAALLALGGMAVVQTAAAAPPPMEQCYGVNKAHKNDCASGANACAGQSAKNRDPGAFVLVPKGVCAKIDGGSLKPG